MHMKRRDRQQQLQTNTNKQTRVCSICACLGCCRWRVKPTQTLSATRAGRLRGKAGAHLSSGCACSGRLTPLVVKLYSAGFCTCLSSASTGLCHAQSQGRVARVHKLSTCCAQLHVSWTGFEERRRNKTVREVGMQSGQGRIHSRTRGKTPKTNRQQLFVQPQRTQHTEA